MNQKTSASDSTDAEHPCFVFGMELDGAGGGRPCTGQAGSESPQWLHVDYSSPDAEGWLTARGLNPAVVESLVRFETRPRTTAVDGGLLVVLRGINMNPGADPADMVSLRMWLEPGREITVRQRRLLAIQEIRETLDTGRGPKNLPELIIEIVERIANRIALFVDELEDEVIEHEAAVESQKPLEVRRELSSQQRQVAVVRRFVAPLREALEGLARQSDELLDAKWSYMIRDQSDRITRAVEDLDLVRERLHVVQEELLNRISQEQNDRLYVFSVVAAVFLPISFMTGVFGMNTAVFQAWRNLTPSGLLCSAWCQ